MMPLKKKDRTAHRLVAKTAYDMALAVYEECAKDNEFYRANPDQKEFARRTHGSLLGQARQVLSQMLSSPTVTDDQKEIIYEALVLDNHLQRPVNSVVHGPLQRH